MQYIVQGTTASTRLGNKIKILAIDYVVNIKPNIVNSQGSICVFMFGYDRRCNGLDPAATGIWQVDNFNEVRNPAQTSKYGVQMVKRHNMVVLSNNAGAPFSTGPNTQFTYRQKVNKTVEYTGNTGTIASLFKDNYFFGYCASDVNCCAIAVNGMIHFTDA